MLREKRLAPRPTSPFGIELGKRSSLFILRGQRTLRSGTTILIMILKVSHCIYYSEIASFSGSTRDYIVDELPSACLSYEESEEESAIEKGIHFNHIKYILYKLLYNIPTEIIRPALNIINFNNHGRRKIQSPLLTTS